MGGHKYCIFYGCMSNTRKCKNLSFFKLPLDADRRLKWLKIVNRLDLAERDLNPKSHVVCSKHFEKSAIIMTPRLKADAMPIAGEKELIRDQATQTDVEDSYNISTLPFSIDSVKTEPEEYEIKYYQTDDCKTEDSGTEDTDSDDTDTKTDIKEEIEVTETEIAAVPVNTMSLKRKPHCSLSKSSPKKIKLYIPVLDQGRQFLKPKKLQ